MRFILSRVSRALLQLLGISILSFVLFAFVPGDYFSEARLNPQISPETLSALRHQYGLDQSIAARYFHWLGAALRCDFGFSFAYNIPVSRLLRDRIVNTLLLTVPATLLAWLLAIPLGVIGAEKQDRAPDKAIGFGTTVLLITPDVLIALVFLRFAIRTGYMPTGGAVSLGFENFGTWAKIKDIAAHAWVPITVIVLSVLPVLVRHVRATMVETLHAPFVRAARAHGIPRQRLLYRHVFPAAINPLISLLGLSIANLLGVSLITEVVLSWPGIGPLLLEAVLARDLYVVIGTVLVSAALLQAGIFVSDLMLYAADPRIRRSNAA